MFFFKLLQKLNKLFGKSEVVNLWKIKLHFLNEQNRDLPDLRQRNDSPHLRPSKIYSTYSQAGLPQCHLKVEFRN